MALGNVDRDLERAERDASPERFPGPVSPGTDPKPEQPPAGLERVGTASSSSSSSASTAPGQFSQGNMSRVNTQRDLERHPTAISRIQTHRSQHASTVGRTVRSRESRKPLPEFGAGKPYPPPLPEQEEYVVEFCGPTDPLHPQNWDMKKKCVA